MPHLHKPDPTNTHELGVNNVMVINWWRYHAFLWTITRLD